MGSDIGKARRSAVSLLVIVMTSCGGGGGGSAASTNPSPAPAAFGNGPADCVSGRADGYDCDHVALLKHVPLSALGGTAGNDIWGWVDPDNGDEYVLMGMNNGTAFVRVTDPRAPVVVGRLPTQTVASPWRDIKVYGSYAYVVADSAGSHGMQVFDLTRLRSGGTGQTFSADVVAGGFGSAHNVAIDADTGYAYVVGSDTCQGGLREIDISQPINPLFAGCFTADQYTHDTECVSYNGPDTDHTGAEICFAADETFVGIVDVTNKAAPVGLSRLTYPNSGYVHQAIPDPTQRYVLVDDENDENQFGVRTGTIVLDVTDLDAPKYVYTHRLSTRTTDHNLMIVGNRVYEANYQSGLRVLAFDDLATDTFRDIGFLDTHPDGDGTATQGAWGVYVFPSGTIAVSDIERGLYLLAVQ